MAVVLIGMMIKLTEIKPKKVAVGGGIGEGQEVQGHVRQ